MAAKKATVVEEVVVETPPQLKPIIVKKAVKDPPVEVLPTREEQLSAKKDTKPIWDILSSFEGKEVMLRIIDWALPMETTIVNVVKNSPEPYVVVLGAKNRKEFILLKYIEGFYLIEESALRKNKK